MITKCSGNYVKHYLPCPKDTALTRLEGLLTTGHYLKRQDGVWWVFSDSGDGVANGDTLRELLGALA